MHRLFHRLHAEFPLNTPAVLDDIVDAELQVADAEWFLQVFIGSSAQSFLDVFLLGLSRQQDDGQIVVVFIGL